jgi:hypothetical protein
MKTARGSFKIALSLFLVVQMLFGYFSAVNFISAQGVDGPLDSSKSVVNNRPIYSGVDDSLAAYLCVPSKDSVGTALYSCIGKMYRFGIAFGAIALVFFIVFAGYLYITGGETGKEKGKSVFLSALTGMAIILSSYVLLSFINPELTKIKVIQPPIFTAADLPKCVDVGLGENCVLPNGQVNTGGTGVPGSAAEATYAPLIAKYAPRIGQSSAAVNYCVFSSLISKESSYRYNIASNGPPDGSGNTVLIDINNSNKKFYNLTFTNGGPNGKAIKGHGIGLGQIFIYGPPASWSSKGWVDSLTPARSEKASFGFDHLTVTDLLDPDKNLNASSAFFAKIMKDKGGDVKAAYRVYSGGEPDFQTGTNSKYNQCLLKQAK